MGLFGGKKDRRKKMKTTETENYNNGQKMGEGHYTDEIDLISHHVKNGQKWSEEIQTEVLNALRKKDGNYVDHYDNGQKMIEENYKNGELDGLQIRWYKNGQKWTESNYKDGEEGLSTTWYENGQKQYESTWYENDKEKIIGWDKNGKKQTEFLSKDKKLDGLWTEWYENGQKKEEGNYKNDKKEGVWTSWDKGGNVTKTETWKDS